MSKKTQFSRIRNFIAKWSYKIVRLLGIVALLSWIRGKFKSQPQTSPAPTPTPNLNITPIPNTTPNTNPDTSPNPNPDTSSNPNPDTSPNPNPDTSPNPNPDPDSQLPPQEPALTPSFTRQSGVSSGPLNVLLRNHSNCCYIDSAVMMVFEMMMNEFGNIDYLKRLQNMNALKEYLSKNPKLLVRGNGELLKEHNSFLSPLLEKLGMEKLLTNGDTLRETLIGFLGIDLGTIVKMATTGLVEASDVQKTMSGDELTEFLTKKIAGNILLRKDLDHLEIHSSVVNEIIDFLSKPENGTKDELLSLYKRSTGVVNFEEKLNYLQSVKDVGGVVECNLEKITEKLPDGLIQNNPNLIGEIGDILKRCSVSSYTDDEINGILSIGVMLYEKKITKEKFLKKIKNALVKYFPTCSSKKTLTYNNEATIFNLMRLECLFNRKMGRLDLKEVNIIDNHLGKAITDCLDSDLSISKSLYDMLSQLVNIKNNGNLLLTQDDLNKVHALQTEFVKKYTEKYHIVGKQEDSFSCFGNIIDMFGVSVDTLLDRSLGDAIIQYGHKKENPSVKKLLSEHHVDKNNVPKNIFIQLSRYDNFSYSIPMAEKVQLGEELYHYELCSTIMKSGSKNGGHYTIYIQREGVWYDIDDTSSRERALKKDDVIRDFGRAQGGIGGKKPTALHYKLVKSIRPEVVAQKGPSLT